jgi:hypothetical protein
MTGPAPGGLYNARRSRTRGPASRDKAPGERRDTPFWRPRRLRCRSPPRPSAPALARGTRVPFPTAATNTSAALRRSAPPHSSGSRNRGVAPYRSPPQEQPCRKMGLLELAWTIVFMGRCSRSARRHRAGGALFRFGPTELERSHKGRFQMSARFLGIHPGVYSRWAGESGQSVPPGGW